MILTTNWTIRVFISDEDKILWSSRVKVENLQWKTKKPRKQEGRKSWGRLTGWMRPHRLEPITEMWWAKGTDGLAKKYGDSAKYKPKGRRDSGDNNNQDRSETMTVKRMEARHHEWWKYTFKIKHRGGGDLWTRAAQQNKKQEDSQLLRQKLPHKLRPRWNVSSIND